MTRRERRELASEKEKKRALKFPSLIAPIPNFELQNGRALNGEDFRTYPGLLDTDSVDMPGVAARLNLSTILPRDEGQYFGDPLSMMQIAEQELTKVKTSYRFS